MITDILQKADNSKINTYALSHPSGIKIDNLVVVCEATCGSISFDHLYSLEMIMISKVALLVLAVWVLIIYLKTNSAKLTYKFYY